jgi:hypothetical protein
MSRDITFVAPAGIEPEDHLEESDKIWWPRQESNLRHTV